MNNLENPEDRSNDHRISGSCGCNSWWRLPLLLVLLLAAIVLVNGRGIRRERPGDDGNSSARPANVDAKQTVALEIRGDSGSRSANAMPWREGMTVRDLLAAAAESDSFEAVKFSQQGTGESAFLTQLAGVSNEGAGGRNWMYEVNGEAGDRSFAVYVLQPGDRVLWKFAELR